MTSAGSGTHVVNLPKRELIQRVMESAKGCLADGREPIALELMKRLYDGLTQEDCRICDPEGLAASACNLIDWVWHRFPGELLFRIFDPEPHQNGWGARRTAVQVATEDAPFLLGSLYGELARRDVTVHLVLHPQVSVRRGPEGELLEVFPHGEVGEGVVKESIMYFEIDQLATPADRVELETALRKVLMDVRASVDDWKPMREEASHALAELEEAAEGLPDDDGTVAESIEFLRWIGDDHFTYLGYLAYQLDERDDQRFLAPVAESGLGLFRKVPLGEKARGRKPLRPATRSFFDSPRLISITKSRNKSTVHRNVHMDLISVKRFDDEGRVVGEHRFLGLFTSLAYSITASKIPLVRRKVERVIERTGFLPASHDVKSLRHIVEHYPRDELFQISERDLLRFSLRILEIQLRPRLALLVRWDEEGRFVSCMVYVPRERHSTRMRVQIQDILEHAFHGHATAFSTRISERPLAQVHFIVETQGGRHEVDVEAVEHQLEEVVRSWSERLKEPLGAVEGHEEALRLWRRFRDAFSVAYQEHCSPDDAGRDIRIIDEVLDEGRLGLRLYRRQGAAISRLHLRTFELAVPAPLSSFLPMLENMGLQVNTEMPFEVRPSGAPNPVWVRDFELLAQSFEVQPETAGERFREAFRRIWLGEMENDPFNRLVLTAGLEWRDVVVLRAYCKYLRQTGIAFSQRYMAETLASNPEITVGLVELFHETFDPSRQGSIDGRSAAERRKTIRQDIGARLEKVRSLDQDRILGRYFNLIRSTLRTNFYQRDADGRIKTYISFKLDGTKVRGLPEPRPRFEIFVYSPRVEAVHLRGGPVARGGIRWSDRREDFRTEILGLVKAQMVKNAVIVPVGAKGGFVVKRPPAPGDRDAFLAEGIECYKTMIRGMLDVTDNLDGERIIPPSDVVRRDDDDPYLVVAADKGTATFSDLANRVAAEYGFWLGDAFASGGSVGYDHKKMGITARGAWESVKRHFREVGHDIQTQPFTVVGVGDMSGDVFGNGMLLSEQTQLVGAFNHLHIFVDPDPDPARSYAERQRLFELPRSTWADYDPEALSEGGGIFDRQAKEVTVSDRVRERLGLGDTVVTPAELILALLRSKVHLLWFGGIGTYVKASHESSAQVGDWANDEIRIDAGELGCQVIGEGANLGVTQAGRIEFAVAGGRLNTDFIDNSGGVDCSDHEVNIKIALADAVASGELEPEARDELLAQMTDEVAELVLRDNYLQSQAITLAVWQRNEMLEEQARMMRQLEHSGLLDRKLEGLPDESTLSERRERKQGLTRPEVAVLLAYSKILVYNELLDSRLPDDVLLREDLVRYFPLPMQWNFRPALERHRLRREIIATHVTNSIINRVGPTFVTRLAEDTGSKVSDIARAYAAVREIFALRSLWEDIEALDNKISADLQIRLFLDSVRMIERVARWFLRYAGRPLDVSKCVAKYESDIIVVAAQIEDLLPPREKQRVRRKAKRLRENGLPEGLSSRLAALDVLPAACDVARCAQESQVAVERIGRVYFNLGERLGFERLRRGATLLSASNPYEQAALSATVGDLYSHQADLAQQVVRYETSTKDKARVVFEAWAQDHEREVARIDSLLADIEGKQRPDLAMLTVAERELRRLVELGG